MPLDQVFFYKCLRISYSIPHHCFSLPLDELHKPTESTQCWQNVHRAMHWTLAAYQRLHPWRKWPFPNSHQLPGVLMHWEFVRPSPIHARTSLSWSYVEVMCSCVQWPFMSRKHCFSGPPLSLEGSCKRRQKEQGFFGPSIILSELDLGPQVSLFHPPHLHWAVPWWRNYPFSLELGFAAWYTKGDLVTRKPITVVSWHC